MSFGLNIPAIGFKHINNTAINPTKWCVCEKCSVVITIADMKPIMVNKRQFMTQEPSRNPLDKCLHIIRNEDLLMNTTELHHQTRSETARLRPGAKCTEIMTNFPNGRRQMSILDKITIFENKDDNINEDIAWIVGQEATGTLCVDPLAREKITPLLGIKCTNLRFFGLGFYTKGFILAKNIQNEISTS